MGFLRPERSLAEIEEETEILEAKNKKVGLEYSIAEKRVMAARLKKEYGLSPKYFLFDWSKIYKWLKEH